jgi:DNA anti-recombination protein RmuC
VLAQDLRAHTRRASAASSSTDVALQNTYSDYESTLRTVSELQSLAVQGSQQAESDDQLQEWNNICSQLEMVHRRVLNTIERTVNSTAQSHEGSQTSLISLNRVLAARRNVVTSPSLYPIARNNTGDSGFF